MFGLGRMGNDIVFCLQAEDGIRDLTVTGVQTCALPIFEVVAEPSGPGEQAQVFLARQRSADCAGFALPARFAHRASPLRLGAEMLSEKIDRKRERAVRFGLAVGLAAVPRKGVVRTRVLVDRDERVRGESALEQLVD